MLQKLNDRIQGAVAWIIVSLVTLTFTLFGLDYYLQNHRTENVKVKINGHSITKEEYDLSYRRLSQLQGQDALTPEQERILKQQVLSEMMVNAVSVEVARKHGFEVHNKQTLAAIMQIPQFQEDGHFSTSRYTQALSNAFFTPQTFQQEVQQGMLLNQQRFALIGTEFALPTELAQFVSLSMQKRDYQYAVVKAADFVAKEQVTTDELQKYYKMNQKQFMTKEQVSIDYIRLSLQSLKYKIKIPTEQVARYYEDNKNSYLTPAQWRLEYVRFSVKSDHNEAEEKSAKQAAMDLYHIVQKKPTHFTLLAKKAVQQKQAQSGLLPVVIAGQSDLDHYLINLTEPGQIAEPIRTKQGYEVVQLKSYKPAAIQPLSEVKTLITEQLCQEAAQQQYAELEERLLELSYQNPDSLAPVAESLKVPLEHSALFMRGHPNKEAITQNPAVMQAAFSHDVLAYGNNSAPIQLDADTLVVLRVKEYIPSALQDIAQVRSVIESVILKQKSSLAAQTYGKNLVMSSPKTLPRTLHWQRVIGATRDSEKGDAQVNELAFAVSDTGGYKGHILQNGDYALVRLEKTTDGQLDMTDNEQTRNFTQQLEASYGLMDYDLYISQLMSQAHIVKF
jgi:peptidyl-prolyl cis-trans isomerase D